VKDASGYDVQLGDRVQLWDKRLGKIVCCIGAGQYSDKYPEHEWSYLKDGILVETDNGELFHYLESDEDFELIKN
jgi:hypothetical protein